MKFLIISQYFYPEVGATQTRLSAMCRELIKHGCKVEVLTALPHYPKGVFFPGYAGTVYKTEELQGMLIHRLWVYPSAGSGVKRLVSYLTFVAAAVVGLFFVKEKPDYVFIDSPPPFTAIVGRIYSLIRGVPFIFNVADLWPDTVVQMKIINNRAALKIAYKLESLTYQWAKYINAVTHGNILTLTQKKNVPIDKILFLPNGVDIQMFRAMEPADSILKELAIHQNKIILFAGGLGYAQGLDIVIDAMNILKDRDPDIAFVFLGEGPEKTRLFQKANTRKLNNVYFIDSKPLAAVARYYSIAFAGFASLKDIPLFQEVRPSKIFPAMACGKPIIYSGTGEAAKLIREADCGIVVEPGDIESTAEAISLLAHNSELAKKYGLNGRKYVETNHDWSIIVGNWLASLKERDGNAKQR